MVNLIVGIILGVVLTANWDKITKLLRDLRNDTLG